MMRLPTKMLAVGLLMAVPKCAAAEEQGYYDSLDWQISLVNTYADNGALPHCSMKTKKWTSKFVSLEPTLHGIDDVRMSVRVQKDGWGLPVGATTTVRVSIAVPVDVQVRATSDTELYGVQTEVMSKDHSYLSPAAFDDSRPIGLSVLFEGDEGFWNVADGNSFDAFQLRSRYRECVAALKELGPQIFDAATTTAEKTTPFGEPDWKKKQGGGGMTHQQYLEYNRGPSTKESASSAATSLSNLRLSFERSEEDAGPTCNLDTRSGEVSITLLAQPGKHFIALVDGIGLEARSAIWQADTNRLHVIRGEVDDYFGSLWFPIEDALMAEFAQAKTMKFQVSGMRMISVNMAMSRDAIAEFQSCHGSKP